MISSRSKRNYLIIPPAYRLPEDFGGNRLCFRSIQRIQTGAAMENLGLIWPAISRAEQTTTKMSLGSLIAKQIKVAEWMWQGKWEGVGFWISDLANSRP